METDCHHLPDNSSGNTVAEQRARKTCFRKNVAEDDVSTGHSPRMRLAREAIAKRYFADENKLDAELYVCLCPP